MAWTLFRTKKGLRKVEEALEKQIADLNDEIEECIRKDREIWDDIKERTAEAGYGTDTDYYIRSRHGDRMRECDRILDKKVWLERVRIDLEKQLIKVQLKIKKSIL